MVLRMRRATILWLLLLILLHAAIGRNIRSVVFDVGFNDGLDTASFLAQGFRVVAVEANAGLVLAFSKKEPFSYLFPLRSPMGDWCCSMLRLPIKRE